MNSEKSILRFMKVYNINSPEGLQNKRSEDATLSVGDDNTAKNSNKTEIINVDQSDDTYNGEEMDHFNIDDANVDDAINMVQEAQPKG